MTVATDIDWARHATDRAAAFGGIAARPAVAAAIARLRTDFADHPLHAWPSGDGGAVVVIEALRLSERWTQESTWLGFHLSPLYPDAGIYPHYVAPTLTHVDATPVLPPMHTGNSFDGQPAIMVSRRSKSPDTGADAATRKARAVLRFVNTRG